MNRQISQALGWAIGVLVIFPFIIYGVNILFKSKENNGKKYVKKYLESCDQVSTKFPNYSDYKLSYDHYTTSLLSPSETIYKIKFFDSIIKKNCQITFFNYPDFEASKFTTVLHDKKIIIYLNKDDLNNSIYGTKENPIPVFRVREDLPDSVSRNRGPEDGWNVDITDNQFKYNVEQYLTYIMPKEEFKKRFGRGK
ncbi:hypothetical protein [Pedobacter jejuensis]|uniref:DUF8188 domain-containing protein n=1 Tax=Pedobacter jejuensis TaxID=1268550 RepID=A0A3N0C0W4_9SPHI|nr:hypothetical protein [Pedobacter jejuensis]RNL55853.1 hypothetical protein D7004_03625 [Pedobacter jejuensis]